MRHRHLHRQAMAKGHDDYRALATEVRDAELARAAATAELRSAVHDHRPLSTIRAAYNRIAAVSQEPLPAARALDPDRPAQLTRDLSRLRTVRQWNLLDAPPGALRPASVQPPSRAANGPHVAGLDFDVDVDPDSLFARKQGVNLVEALDRVPSIGDFK